MQHLLDLTEPPYRGSLELLESLRTTPEAWTRLAFREQHTTERGTHDAHQVERDRLVHMLLLHASPSDLDLVRFLLDQEITARKTDSFQGAGDSLTILSLLLLQYSPADPDDTWRFWSAKRANFDTFAGGYDIQFLFAQLPSDQVFQLLEDRAPDDCKMLERYDVPAIVAGLDAWRAVLEHRFPRRLENLTTDHCEHWAELFDDTDGMARFGRMNAATPDARARLFQRLDRHADAVREWRAAAATATTPWDEAAQLRNVLSDAAKVPMDATDAVERLDVLRPQIPSWNQVGLGRMATQACHELAVALDDPAAGRRLWSIAETWRSALDSQSLVGLRAALAAADKWGDADDVARLSAAVDAEQTRIYGDEETDG